MIDILAAPAAAFGLGPAASLPPGCGRALLSALTLEAPMIGMESARLALRCSESKITDSILSGEIEWAFDLARAHSRRWYLRILTESVVVRQRCAEPKSARARSARREQPFTGIFDSLFPHRRVWLHSSELARVWDCSSSHIHNLVRDSLLRLAETSPARREGFHIPRDSVFQFMNTRRIH